MSCDISYADHLSFNRDARQSRANYSGKGISCGDSITRTHRPNGLFIVRHATSVFQIAEEAACGLVTSDCKSTSTASAHLYRFSDSSPRTGDDVELTERGALAAEADTVVRYSALRMARLRADRRRLLSEMGDYG